MGSDVPAQATVPEKEGWGFPLLAKRAHYFVDGVSLCGKWMFTGELDADKGGAAQREDCKGARGCWPRVRRRLDKA